MSLQIQEIGLESLPRYAEIPSRFRVESVLRIEVREGGLGGLALVEEPVVPPYVKDYDAQDEDGGPAGWPQRFDMRRWGIFLAVEGDRPVGGAMVAFDTPELTMLEGRHDLAVLWDIRVHPDCTGRGIGSGLLHYAADWARQRGCTRLKIETQNVNLPACRFYARQGCELGAIHRFGYTGSPAVAHEVMLLWYLTL